MAGKLTARGIAALGPGRHGDGGTLYLMVEPPPSRSRHWTQRLVVDGRRRDIGLGGWPFVGLAEARELAYQNRRLARRGGDPVARAARKPTFRKAAEAVDAAGAWADMTRTNRRAALDAYCGALMDRPVDRIDRADVIGILAPLMTAKPATGRRLRGWVRGALAWAQAAGHVDLNMAGELIDGALPKAPKVREHRRALPYSDLPAALEAVEASGAGVIVAAAIRFVALTAVRSGEARGAAWTEINLEGAVWTIPASRMKTGREHRVPLSNAAVAVLETLRPYSAHGLIFPASRGRGPVSASTLLVAFRAATGTDADVHGLRSSFRDWAAERSGATRDVAELALAHRIGSDVERSYARSDLFDQRRRLMHAWARFLVGGAAAKVVSLGGNSYS